MKKSLILSIVFSLVFLLATASAQVVNTTHAGSGPYTTIQAAIDNSATLAGDIIQVDALYSGIEAVTVSKGVTIQGINGTPTITPPAGSVGITVAANNVTLDNLKVTGTTGGLTKHGIWVNGYTGLTIQNVNATNNAGSGIALRGVSTTTITNVDATNNKAHGLEIGNGSTNVQVNGGTFTGNGTAGNPSYGGGIMIYADAGKATDGTSIFGAVTSSTNTTAGIYIFCDPNGELKNTTIGATGYITLHDNGSTGTYSGGAAVLVYGPCDHTTITATATNSGSLSPVAGLVVLGTDGSGTKSPTNTVAKNCTLTGFTSTSPAATMKVPDGSYICTEDVDATVGNDIGGLSTGFDVEDVLVHKVDNSQLGLFIGPGTTLYVTPNSGSIQRAINMANTYGITQINVKDGTYAENVTVVTPLVINGQGAGTIITPASGDGITISSVDNVTIENLKVYHAPNHGIWARGESGLTITNVVADANGFGGKASGIALRAITGTSILTNITATNNTSHGLEIGRQSIGVQVIGGTFSSNGTADDLSTGGGIMIYSDLTGSLNPVQNTVIKGTLTASNNKTAGIYIYSTPGTVSGTSIGQTGSITLSDNGSISGTYGTGGAGVLIYGGATSTTISALFTRSSVVGGGLVVLGTDNLGTSSPSGTVVQNSTFTGYNSGTSPAITLASETFSGSWTTNAKICTTNVTATTNVTFTGATTSVAIDALIYDKLDMSTLGLVSYTSPSILVKAKVFLQGPFSGSAMTTALNTGTLIPLSSSTAYNTTTYGYTNKTVTAIPNANVVDWVLVELRTGTAAASKVETQAAFLLNNGSIVDIDGSSDLAFNTAAAGNYYIVVRHRNHLAVMSIGTVMLPNGPVYDFTASGQAYGSTPTVAVATGVYAMWCGDTDASGTIDATDRANTWNDRLISGYKNSDTDLSGTVDATDRANTWNNRLISTQVP